MPAVKPSSKQVGGGKIDPVRSAAVAVLLQVFEQGAYLNIALDKAIKRKEISDRGRRFLTQLVYGTVRAKLLCDHVLALRLEQPLDALPRPILAILRMGVFQGLFCQQVTPPAMVHTSVELARKYGHAGTARLVNAVLRRIPPDLASVPLPDPSAEPARYLSVRYSMPEWLVERWVDESGFDGAEVLCKAYEEQAPVTLRVNLLKIGADALEQRLNGLGWNVSRHPMIPDALEVNESPSIVRSHPFREGLFVVEDAASLLPAHLLEPREGDWVLDMCAAPGVKTTHLAQLAGGRARVAAMDIRCGKLRLVCENAERLGVSGVFPLCGDGTAPPFGRCFDRVLVDAPCSGLGTIRHRPDLKWRAAPDLPARMGALQLRLLRSAVELCKNGGVIVYSVCTFSPEETDAVVKACLADGKVEPEDGQDWLKPWRISPGLYRTNPRQGGLDSFFLTRLRKAF